jgi:hypothetical protein
MSVHPWHDSRIRRIREFFQNNPEEELDYEAMVAKFSITKQYAHEVVKQLKREGVVEAVYVIRNPSKGRMQP